MPSTVEFFHFHKKETDLGIGEAADTPPPNHPFSAIYRLYDDPAQWTDPATLRSSYPVSIEKALSIIIFKRKIIKKGKKNNLITFYVYVYFIYFNRWETESGSHMLFLLCLG